MWKRILFFILVTATTAQAQYIPAYQKDIFDFYYLQKLTNSIDGSFIISNSLPPDRIINTGLTQITEFQGEVTGTWNTLTISNNVIDSANIIDNTIVDADVSPAAAIQPTKIQDVALTQVTVFGTDVIGTYNTLTIALKEKFFHIPISMANTVGDYATDTITLASFVNLTFRMPADFVSFISCDAIYISSAGAAGPGKDIDLTSDYAALGEVFNNGSESDLVTTYTISAANTFGAIPLTNVLTGVSASDNVGILVDHNLIGGSLDYIGVYLRYQ